MDLSKSISFFITALLLALLPGGFGCSPRQPLFKMQLPDSLNFAASRAIYIQDGPKSGSLVFSCGLVHLGPDPRSNYEMDTSSLYAWGIFKPTKNETLYHLLFSYPINSGDPFRPIYEVDSVQIDFKNLTSFQFGRKSSSFIKIDTIDYDFPVRSVLLYKKLFRNSKNGTRQTGN